jgi:hypothetical protein
MSKLMVDRMRRCAARGVAGNHSRPQSPPAAERPRPPETRHVDTQPQQTIYDRRLLLSGVKRNAVLELWELRRYGTDSYGDADYVSVYGMRPADWYAKGVRLLGRTAVECTRDALGSAIGRDVAAAVASAPVSPRTVLVDLFAGSGNTLYWLTRHVPNASAVGFELDARVFRLTQQNFGALALPIEILHTSYRSGFAHVPLARDDLLITFIAPPWGDALAPDSGLDLRRTRPPITEIVRFLCKSCAGPMLCAIQVYEVLDAASLAEVEACFDWSALHVYSLNAPGQNHGLLLGSKRWSPRAP